MTQALRNPWARRLGACLVAATLVACGGGGGGDPAPTFSAGPSGPPATAAVVGTSTVDATKSAQTVVQAADGLVSRRGSLQGVLMVLGVPPTALGPSVLGIASVSPSAGMKKAMAVSHEPCTSFVSAPCSGSATIDSSLTGLERTVKAGQYLDASFDALSGYMQGIPVSLGGRLRIEFLTDINLNSSSFAWMGLRIVFGGFSGTINGESFGPFTETVDLQFDAQAVPTLVADGARYGSLAGVSVSGPGDYLVNSGSVRLPYGSVEAGYVDVTLAGWHSSGGRPAAGSTATLAAPGSSVSVSVLSSTTETVVYQVRIDPSASPSTTYFLLATYPAGGGAPVYTIQGG